MKLTISQEGSNPITIKTFDSHIKSNESGTMTNYIVNRVATGVVMAAERAAYNYLIYQFPKLIKAIYSKCANYITGVNTIEDFVENPKFLKCLDNTKRKHEKDGFPTLTEVESDYKATTKSKFICKLFDSHKDPNIEAGAKNFNVSLRRIHEVPVCILRIPEPRPNRNGVKCDVLASTMFVKNGDSIKSIPLARAEINKRR